MNADKLAKLQASVRIGGKGTPRRKVKKVVKNPEAEEKKLTEALKKMATQSIPTVQHVNMFKTDGKVLHFSYPRVQASIASHVFVVEGKGQLKEMTDLLPDIIHQMDPEALSQLTRLAQSFGAGGAAAAAAGDAAGAADEDDDIPDLVENFEEEAKA